MANVVSTVITLRLVLEINMVDRLAVIGTQCSIKLIIQHTRLSFLAGYATVIVVNKVRAYCSASTAKRSSFVKLASRERWPWALVLDLLLTSKWSSEELSMGKSTGWWQTFSSQSLHPAACDEMTLLTPSLANIKKLVQVFNAYWVYVWCIKHQHARMTNNAGYMQLLKT